MTTINPISGISVSGGIDSMALCTLIAKHKELEKWPKDLFGYTVDHRIRPESSNEASLVGTWVEQIGTHACLPRLTTRDKPSCNQTRDRFYRSIAWKY